MGLGSSDRRRRSGRSSIRSSGTAHLIRRFLSQVRRAMAQCSRSTESALTSGDHISKLTDDILAEIISRVPYKSACRCKCVSTRWRDLVAHPDYRKKMPQTLAGFFYKADCTKRGYPTTAHYFTNAATGAAGPLADASLPFLPKCKRLDILDCCNGLLLCRCWKSTTDPKKLEYVVCNPATEKWMAVPATEWFCKVQVARLGFDPAVSSHFHVYEFVGKFGWDPEEDEVDYSDGQIQVLATYSSKAGVWTHRKVEHDSFDIPRNSYSVFLNGILYLAALDDMVLAVDAGGNNWWLIRNPMRQRYEDVPPYNVFLSQGQLYLAESATGDGDEASHLSVWVLEDHSTGKWTLKHHVSYLELFGTDYAAIFQHDCTIISFHPERNMVFMIFGSKDILMSYEMDSKKLRIIDQSGPCCYTEYDQERSPYLAYIPLLSESLADEG